MNVRRERIHACGLTNIDFRTKGDFQSLDRFRPSLKYSDVGTMGKTGFKAPMTTENLDERVQTKAGWKSLKRLDPRSESAVMFYQQNSKKQKAPVLVAKPRNKLLEQEQWDGKIFTGDDIRATATKTFKAAERDA